MKLYVKKDCPMCAEIVIPEGIKVNKVDVDNGYDGYVPASVPVLQLNPCLLYTSPSPRDATLSRMPSSA